MNSELIKTLKRYVKSLNTKMKIENKSEHTIKSYNYTYNSFFEFLKEHDIEISLLDISEGDIYAFFEFKSDKKGMEISNATSNAILSHLKKLFGHIERNARSESFDFRRVFEDIKIKTVRKKPKGLSVKEQQALLLYLDKELKSNPNNFLHLRNSFLIKLMLFGGLRVSEALSISLDDLKEGDGLLYEIEFTGKGNKERFTVIDKFLIGKEVKILKEITDLEQSEPVAVTNDKKNRIKRENFYTIVNRIYERAGLDCSGLHVLRHTFAKNLIDNDKPITILQSLLGHSSLQTTSIYTNPTREMVVLSMSNYSEEETRKEEIQTFLEF